ILLSGCGSPETCALAVDCAGGGNYRACSDGSGCRYLTSDGHSFACTSCGDCASAVAASLAWCGMQSGGVGGNGNGNSSVPQTQACIDYLACIAVANPSQLATAVMTYGPSGSCWGAPSTARACDTACAGLLNAERSVPNPPAACVDGGGGGA